jgi:hypothetical protein
MNDVQAIEQPIQKGAGGNSIEERDGGARDDPDSGRGAARELESGEQVNQRVLDRRGQFLDSVNQQAASRGTIEDTAAVLQQRLRFDRKITGPEM